MKRTLPWAIFAFYPFIAVAAFNLLDGPFQAYLAGPLAASWLGALVVAFWWPFLAGTAICVTAFFFVSALRNRVLPAWHRILWAAGIAFLSAIVVPAYWWRYSEHGAR